MMSDLKQIDSRVLVSKKTENAKLPIKILSDLTVFGKYAKYIPSLNRRESWEEIVTRNMGMHIKKYPQLETEIRETYKFVYDKKVLPSMRSMQFAGKPIDVNPARVYNCCYLPIDSIHAFSEAMFLLLGGTGVGYSVQYHHVSELPEIQKPNRTKRYLVADSIEGWADAVKALTKAYLGRGAKPVFDFSDIRPKGARLITAGGKAPGAEPLKLCLSQVEAILESKSNGDKLEPIECHDILCHIANAVLAGGIRRAAMIAGFSFNDPIMAASKSNFKILNWENLLVEQRLEGNEEPTYIHSIHLDERTGDKYYDLKVEVAEPGYGVKSKIVYWVSEKDLKQVTTTNTLPWYYFQEQRGRANNSAVILRHKINKKDFMKLWKQIEASGSGEPGLYFSNDKDWFTNPCCEIALRPYQFCNLCEINASDLESQEDLNARVKAAAFIGSLQAGYTDFHYLRDVWKKTTEKDALLGVGMTGIGSGVVLQFDLTQAAEIVKLENERISKIIGTKAAARTTCVKPSGTTSCVLGTSSGIHAWHDQHYIRRIRLGKNEALYTYLSIYAPDLLEDDYFRPESQACVSIPQKAPLGAILRQETALDLLERVKKLSFEWVLPGHSSGNNTHNVSATVSIKDNEWDTVGEWMWKNREFYNGLSVLPYDGGSYIQAPFETITEKEYEQRLNALADIDLTQVVEIEDQTDLTGEAACGGAGCEVK